MRYKGEKGKLWKLFSEYIRRSSGGVCYTCGVQKDWRELDAGHYEDAGNCGLYLLFDERNVHAQCTYCNRFKHGNKTNYALALTEDYGKNILKQLKQDRQKITKDFPYQEKIAEYQQKLHEIETL